MIAALICVQDVVVEEMRQAAELQARKRRLARFRVKVKGRVRKWEREKGASMSQLLPERELVVQNRVGQWRRPQGVSLLATSDEVQVEVGSGRRAACHQLVVHCGEVRGSPYVMSYIM